MKKYIFTEGQVRNVVNDVIKEQTDIQLTNATVQCFLNHPTINATYKLGQKLLIDGKAGPGSLTEKALKKFQQIKASRGYQIDVDGIWGYRTQQTLLPQEQQIWTSCRKHFERP